MDRDFINMKGELFISNLRDNLSLERSGNMTETRIKIRTYLLRLCRNHELNDDDDLFELGIVHSLFTVQLILFIEKEFGLEIEDEELDLDKLRTVNSIVDLVEKKLAKK